MFFYWWIQIIKFVVCESTFVNYWRCTSIHVLVRKFLRRNCFLIFRDRLLFILIISFLEIIIRCFFLFLSSYLWLRATWLHSVQIHNILFLLILIKLLAIRRSRDLDILRCRLNLHKLLGFKSNSLSFHQDFIFFLFNNNFF